MHWRWTFYVVNARLYSTTKGKVRGSDGHRIACIINISCCTSINLAERALSVNSNKACIEDHRFSGRCVEGPFDHERNPSAYSDAGYRYPTVHFLKSEPNNRRPINKAAGQMIQTTDIMNKTGVRREIVSYSSVRARGCQCFCLQQPWADHRRLEHYTDGTLVWCYCMIMIIQAIFNIRKEHFFLLKDESSTHSWPTRDSAASCSGSLLLEWRATLRHSFPFKGNWLIGKYHGRERGVLIYNTPSILRFIGRSTVFF